MGAGKSYLGNRLSYLFNLHLVDIDIEIEKELNMKIPEIFFQKGESLFRKVERSLFKQHIVRNNVIISCGGGLTESAENRKLIKDSNSIVIFLDPEWSIIWKRIMHSERPLVKSKSEEEVRQLWLSRISNYLDCATARLNPQQSIDEFVSRLVDFNDAMQLTKLLLH